MEYREAVFSDKSLGISVNKKVTRLLFSWFLDTRAKNVLITREIWALERAVDLYCERDFMLSAILKNDSFDFISGKLRKNLVHERFIHFYYLGHS